MGWILAFGIFLVLIPVIGFVLRGLLASGVITSEGGHSARPSPGASIRQPASVPAFIPGSSEESYHHDRNDLLTDPVYSHLPANIFHSQDEDIASTDIGSEIDIHSGPDYLTDPMYSYLPFNIYYSDDSDDPFNDDFGSNSISSSFDDDSGIHTTSSSFDDDFGSSSFSSSFDDDWHSSSFDD